jgi:hypothetical protein
MRFRHVVSVTPSSGSTPRGGVRPHHAIQCRGRPKSFDEAARPALGGLKIERKEMSVDVDSLEDPFA